MRFAGSTKLHRKSGVWGTRTLLRVEPKHWNTSFSAHVRWGEHGAPVQDLDPGWTHEPQTIFRIPDAGLKKPK
jgi:hypothetical protein